MDAKDRMKLKSKNSVDVYDPHFSVNEYTPDLNFGFISDFYSTSSQYDQIYVMVVPLKHESLFGSGNCTRLAFLFVEMCCKRNFAKNSKAMPHILSLHSHPIYTRNKFYVKYSIFYWFSRLFFLSFI